MMNERIRELIAKSTWVQFVEGVGHKEVFDKEQFAELLIRECMRMCDVASIGYDTHGLFKEANGASLAKVYIADWFEIEEDSEVESDKEETCPRCGAPDSGTSCGLPDCGWVTGEQE